MPCACTFHVCVQKVFIHSFILFFVQSPSFSVQKAPVRIIIRSLLGVQDITSYLLTKMLLQVPFYAAFSILSFSSHASTSVTNHARFHRHSHPTRIDSRSDSASVQVPLSELQLLQTETNSFQQWMTSWIDSESHTDRESSVALLQQEINAYQGWMAAWLKAVNSPGGPSSIPLPPRIPVTLPAGSSLELSTSHSRHFATSLPSAKTTTRILSTPLPSAGEFFQQPYPSNQSIPTVSPSNPSSQSSFVTSTTIKPSEISLPPPRTQVSTSSVTAPTQISTSPTATPSQISGGPSGGNGPSSGFNPQSSQNLAVYYGQSGATSQFTLGDMCKNENVDIVILAFLTEFFGPGGFPTLNFGPACGGQTPEMKAAGATGLLSCPDMAAQITECQGLGKKVLLSLGGSLATTAFSSDSQASEFATKLWDLFGSGTGVDAGLRPFGHARVDGFDVGKSFKSC